MAHRFLSDPIFGHPGLRARFDSAAAVAAMIRVEAALARAQGALGMIPGDAAAAIARNLPGIDADIAALADGVRSEGVAVPALVKALRAGLGPEADWLHYGATSQDIVDTALCLCARDAIDDLGAMLAKLVDALERLSDTHAGTLMLGRTRGQPATPITFGLRLATWAEPLIALEAELPELRQTALRVQLGGASGSRSVFAGQGARLSARLAEELGLSDSPPWHTDRSGIQRLAGWLARLVAALAKIGRDVALSTRGEIAELRIASGGSSTMPHKANPVTAEALQSLAPMAAGHAAGLAASAVHAEERDGAMWPVEWALIPALFETAGAALTHAEALFAGMKIDVAAMRARLDAMPDVYAEAAVFALAPELGRSEAARVVAGGLAGGASLREALSGYGGIEWDAVFSDDAFTRPAADTARSVFARRRATSG